MKRQMMTIALGMVMGLLGTSAMAQSNVSLDYGVKGGVNCGHLALSDDFKVLDSKMKAGADFGGFMRINLHQNFAIQPELEFYYRGSGLEANVASKEFENKINQWGMQIPVYALGKVAVGNGTLYGGVGPFVGVGFSAKTDEIELLGNRVKIEPIDLYEEHSEKSALQRWDVGIACQLGYEFANGIQINAGYKYGFINQVDDLKSSLNDVTSKLGMPLSSDDYKANASVLTVGVGYRF
ncbi:MAG: porin family protein [Porphyromonas somerae]|uniref:porin family protein n=1 Tax=Porphyromonas somerae TaxID=322095 RepID=UPI0026F0EEA4|nr:porin family protein [Porphyromonas somerae]MDD7557618.1 porin family protein [Porphyromonas somerae]MDY3119363.1 porin family protein [Porphyromonas somerae]MDY3884884.1 porin family protein [Porphyromonas somerae]MDY5816296.1 porin family protein [Porphyromonas somerae]